MVALFDHQQAAVTRMGEMESKRRTLCAMECRGGVLALPMGMGKTLTTLSFILTRPACTTVVVCPKSLMMQWVAEANRLAFDTVAVYHGVARRLPDFGSHSLLVTTFDVVRVELDTPGGLHRDSTMRRRVWGRVVVDEAHRIAEQSSQTSVAINRLCAPNRWALTGTPFKNGVSDLEALSRFLGIHPYASTRWWKANGDKQMELHRWRDLFMLTSDKNLLRLPAKQESVVHAVRGPGEQSLFETQEQHSNQLLQVGQQRLAANHPLLLFPWTAVERQLQGKTEGCVHCGEGAVKQCAADLHALCGTCVNPCASCVTARLKVDQVEGEWGMHSCKTRAVWECIRAARGTGVKVVLFSQWTSTLDIMAHVLTFYGVGYVQYDGRVNCVEERARRLQMFRDTPNIEVMLISLMAGGEGVNLAFATHVLLCEPYWHATAEMQAIDRLHRIGQTRITRVVRFITSSSIEAWVVSIQTRKCAQEAWMLGDGTPPRTPVISHGKGAIHSFLQGF